MIKLEPIGRTVSLILICTEIHEMGLTGQKLCFLHSNDQINEDEIYELSHVCACKYICLFSYR